MRGGSVLVTLALVLPALVGSCAPARGAIVTPVGLELSTQPAYDHFFAGPITPDGRFIVIGTDAVNPEEGYLGNRAFLLDRQTLDAECVSVDSSGQEGYDCAALAITPDGRFVLLTARALGPDDTGGNIDVFVRDRQTRQTECVTVSSSGERADQHCWAGGISEDGRFVTFSTTASNLVPDDTNSGADVFVRDRLLRTTERVSVRSDGTQGAGGGMPFCPPAISADGRFVAFSSAGGLVDGAGTSMQVYVRDRQLDVTECISVNASGTPGSYLSEGSAISADGRFVAFLSQSPDIIPSAPGREVCVRDRERGVTEIASAGVHGPTEGASPYSPVLSRDGRFVGFNGNGDAPLGGETTSPLEVYLRDRLLGTLQLVSRNTAGEAADWHSFISGISDDARFATFTSQADNLNPALYLGDNHAYLWDRNSYVDVPADFWAHGEITACSRAWVVGGYPDGLYHPETALTRGQMAVFVARAMTGGGVGLPTAPAEASFPDVPPDHWAFRYVEYAASQDIVTGYPDGTYHPEAIVNRGQMAVYIARAIADPTGDAGVPEVPVDTTPAFPDVTSGNEWAWCYKHVQYVADLRIVQGYWDGNYHPEREVTRDQMAVYVQRAFDLPM